MIFKSLAFVTTLILYSATASGEVINMIYGLDIGGTKYDVTFHECSGCSFNALWDADDDGNWGGGTSLFSTAPTFWGNVAGADEATTAIINYLDIFTATAPAPGTSDSFLVPYSSSYGTTYIRAGEDSISSSGDIFYGPASDQIGGFGTFDYEYDPLTPYATFNISTVPVPTAAWLFGSGLLGLISVARRKE